MKSFACMAGAIALMAWSPVRAEPMAPELKTLATELTTAAIFVGMCERYIPRDEADSMLADMARNRTAGVGGDFISNLMLQGYAEGRASEEAKTLTAESCRNLVRDQTARVSDAWSKAEAATNH